MSNSAMTSRTETQTLTQTQDETRNLVSRLKLRFDGSQIPLDLNRFEECLAARPSGANLTEMVNYLFEVFGQLDDERLLSKLSSDVDDETRWQTSDEFESIKDQFLEFIVKKLEGLISKSRSGQSNDFKSLIVLIIQLIKKNYSPKKLLPHYKSFIKFLKIIRDNKIINEILSFWTQPRLDISSIQDELLPIIKKNLCNKDHRIRSKCLKILAFNYSEGEKVMNTKIIKILNSFSEDQEPRVRITALELMLLLHLNGISVPVEYYENIKNSLFDDYERVRMLSTQLICLLAYSYPEYMVTIGDQIDDEKVRLADDVFSKICIMINDISVDVKVCASNLLGKIDLVSSRFLLQTLDKKLMNDLRLKKSAQTIRQKQLVSNDWSAISGGLSSSSSSADAVITKEDEGNLSLMTSGACGAYIHGLEDEFLEVRGESVESLCRQAVHSPKLAAKSIDFLVDMFNDEIEAVRLKAILALTKILHYVLLGDDQIEIVVSVIEDSSFNVRESLKDLLSKCKLATKIGLKKTIQALFNNLRKYPIDKNSIWRCFKSLGKNHAKFIMSLVSYLVSLHPFIDVVEPDINDIYYVSSLILIFNGVNENSAILPLLPRYVINHYFFLKLKIPDLIPDIRLIENYSNTMSNVLIDSNRLNTAKSRDDEIVRFFAKTKHSLKLINLAEDLNENKIKTYELLSKDIKYLCEIDSSISVACEIMKNFVDCCLIIKKKESVANSFKEKTNTDTQRLIQIEEGLLISIRLILLFKGYNCQEKIVLFKLYLYLRALYLKELYTRKSLYNANSLLNFYINSYLKINIRKDLVKECRLYLSLLKYFDKILDKNFKNLIFQIIKELPIEQNRLRQIEAIMNEKRTGGNSFEFEFFTLSDKPNNYRKMSLELLEPVENFEQPIRFTPGLVSAIKVKAILHNFTRFDNLYIQVTYTDNDKQFIPVEMGSIRLISNEKHLLDSTVYLSNLALTDSCSIKICITMLIDEYKSIKQNVLENLDRGDAISLDSSSGEQNSILSESLNQNSRNLKNNLNPIELSKFVKIYFEPLAKKFH